MESEFSFENELFHDIAYIDDRDRLTIPSLIRGNQDKRSDLVLELLSDDAVRVSTPTKMTDHFETVSMQKGIRKFDGLRFLRFRLDGQGRIRVSKVLAAHLRLREKGKSAEAGAIHFLASPETQLIVGDERYRELVYAGFASAESI